MRKFLILAVLLTAFCVFAYFRTPAYATRTLHLEAATVEALIADTEFLRARGLSGRPSLGENEGMLFVFPEERKLSFWMKEMHFPIDIIWIDAGMRVVGISYDLLPESYPETFSPPELAQYALEVHAGFSKLHGIAPGTLVSGVTP